MIAELLASAFRGNGEHITTCGIPPLSLWLNATGAPDEIPARAGHLRAHAATCLRAPHRRREDLIGQQVEDALDPDSSTPPYRRFARWYFFELLFSHTTWGGWGSNPRPADYKKPGPALRMRFLHGYHGVMPPIALIAPFARVARSTNRSAPYHGDHRMTATERYCPPGRSARARARRRKAARGEPNVANRRATGFDYKHEIIRRVHQERDQAPAVRAEMQ